MAFTIRNVTQVLAGVVIASATVVACSSTVDGTPLADPNAAPLTTETTTPRTSSPTTTPRSGSPTIPTRTSAPGAPGTPAVADTTCEEYIDLDEDAQREVISAIGEENELVALNPELWITVTSALCTFAEPTTPVREVLAGQGIR